MNLKDRRIQLPRCPDCGQRVYYRTDGTKTEAGSWEEHECPGQPTDGSQDDGETTGLSDSLDQWPPEKVRHEFRSVGEKWFTWASLWRGAAVALGVRLSPHTNGPELGVVNLDDDTRPPSVQRDLFDYKDEMVRAFKVRLERMDEWPQDDRNYGPGPFDYPDHYDGDVKRGEADD